MKEKNMVDSVRVIVPALNFYWWQEKKAWREMIRTKTKQKSKNWELKELKGIVWSLPPSSSGPAEM